MKSETHRAGQTDEVAGDAIFLEPAGGDGASRLRGARKVDVSIVIPVLNEEENVIILHDELTRVMEESALGYEVIFVDDGSTDGTADRLREILDRDPRAAVVELRRRFGQTAGLAAGFRLARGRVIVPMDGDLQNDPRDIPRLVHRLLAPPGWDVVSGWRKDRKDRFLSRRLPSVVANWLIRKMTHTMEVHDFGCTLKAYSREILNDINLYGEMHRFLPAICKWHGARVTEEVVNHRPRVNGSSKYGLRRTIKVLLDLITVKFLGDYLAKPLYFFGKGAGVSLLVSFLALGVALLQKAGYLTDSPLPLNRNVLVLFAMMWFLMAVMFIMMGVISELLVRIYHESQDRTYYNVRRVSRSGAPGNGVGVEDRMNGD
jgi:glycosyltransferase involved in cell wall biosynthesis